MFCTLRLIGVGLLAAALATPLSAEPTPGPPDWDDAGGSIYQRMKPQVPEQEEPAVAQAQTADESSNAAPVYAASTPKVDSFVTQAIHEVSESSTAEGNKRRLAPPTSGRFTAKGIELEDAARTPAPKRPQLNFGMPTGSIYTVLSALAIVIGAFLIFAWLLRRGGRKSNASLPGDVVSVLGRVPLAARQFAHLLRVGNKLVLVTITPTGAETLTEVTDPVEVDRLVGLCQQYGPHSTTKAFEQVFRQLSGESAPPGFLGGESLPQSLSSAASAYRAHRGNTARG